MTAQKLGDGVPLEALRAALTATDRPARGLAALITATTQQETTS